MYNSEEVHINGPPYSSDPYGYPSSHPSLQSEQASNRTREDDILAPHDKVLWKPIWLRKRILVLFIGLFTTLWISILLLWRYDIKHNGFGITISSSHYSWTYGPTLLLTIIVSFWRQVDYYCKISQPWMSMGFRIADARKSLLLDYVSPFELKSLYKATKNRHWAVAASNLGFVILKFITVISTVLLQPSPTLLSKSTPVTIMSQFNESTFWNFVTPNSERPVFDFNDQENYPYFRSRLTVSSLDPLFVYADIVRNGIRLPNGTLAGNVFQDIDMLGISGNVTSLRTNVTAFVSNVTCETSTTKPEQKLAKDWGLTPPHATVETSSCSANRFAVSGWVTNEVHTEHHPHYILARTFTPVNCSRNSTSSRSPAIKGPNLSSNHGLPDTRLAFIIHNFTIPDHPLQTYTDPFFNHTIPWGSTLTRSAAVVCKVNYDLRPADLTHYPANGTISLNVSEPEPSVTRFNNLTESDLGEALFAMLGFHGDLPSATNVFELMKDNTKDFPPGSEFAPFMDPGILKSSASVVLEGLMVQMMQQFALVPGAANTSGTALITENRLHIQPASLWIMVASLIVLSALPLVVLVSVPTGTVSQDPTSVATLASILTASTRLQSLLKDTSTLRTSELTDWLDGYLFKATVNPHGTFSIEPIGSAPLYKKASTALVRRKDKANGIRVSPSMQPEDVRHKHGSWIPTTVKYPFITLTFALPVIAIGALELLYQLSRRDHGLAASDRGLKVYAGYSTSVVTAVISSTLSSVEFAIASFAPFHVLCRRQEQLPGSTRLNLLGNMPPWATYYAFRYGEIAAALSGITGLIGSILTVVASGLWVDRPLHFTSAINTSMATTWDVKRPKDLGVYDDAASTFARLHFQGGEQPLGIWHNLVFPTLTSLEVSTHSIGSKCSDPAAAASCQFNLTLPALRPRLVCEPVPLDRVEVGQELSELDFPFSITLPKHCVKDVPTYYIGPDTGTPDWIGYFAEVAIGSKSVNDTSSSTLRNTSSSSLDRAGCPSISIDFGGPLGDRIWKSNFTVLACHQKLEQIPTAVNFVHRAADEGRIGASNLLQSPVTEESKAKYLINDIDGSESFFFSGLSPLLETLPNIGFGKVNNTTLVLDPVFSALVQGANLTTLQELSGPNKTDKLINVVTDFYTAYMAIIMNSEPFRKPVKNGSLSDAQALVEGTVTTEISRLTVDFTSKLILQVMLAIIIAFSAVATWLAELRGMLPRNPCSIASVMALLAGSSLCDREVIPLGSEWKSQRELREIIEPHNVKLGWWNGEQAGQESEEKGRFGVDIGDPISLGFKLRRGKKHAKEA
ncbi:hypothetical protein F5Y03DRAFT_30422 [Xylaria venustula]|nr:hypothetical protein F5Y03DRAFT_30422 [Xylaria venustula]